ncbi:ATP-grasp fold amidoligase family protein [Pontibacter russatus]|uniref:ATP-grasp fold amidoligase family protein n=1 Tax=Pontibacter russatus TaxID=2694929 RepID=UPI00137AF039|nr:ATP-grasp fold amidoligase family protein [Pontibacter russatus]
MADAEAVRNSQMSASDALEKWQDVKNWQRKLSNKHNSREFAKMHGCRVPELYWRGREPKTTDFGALPETYVIRPTIGHSSGLVFLMDGPLNLMDQKTYTPESIRSTLQEALDQNPDLEFLVEEFLRDEKGEHRIPDDYKFYMFNGEVASIQVINRLGPSSGYTSCYDENWNLMPSVNTYYPQADYQQPPQCLQDMIAQARLLSKSYGIFARIDFYATDKGAVFGEFTPTPFKGKFFTPEAEKMFVDYWDKYCAGLV